MYAVVTALATLGLICMGGLVTSKGVGMSVPDWPTSFGYNMFALPVSQWFHGGVFDEHTHRLWASTVGVLVVFLTRWLGGTASRRWLAFVGVAEVAGGLGLLALGPAWRGAGYFLSGIGGVVLVAAAVWFRSLPVEAPLPRLGWLAFWAVQVQGLLGGLRVVLDQWTVGNLTFGVVLGLIHGCLGQAFFVLLGIIALRLSPFWDRLSESLGSQPLASVRRWMFLGVALVSLQLLLGASMRHQHAGLAITDFPTSYGRWWPALDADALVRYNQNRVDDSTVTSAQILLQLLHRLGAVATVLAVLTVWRTSARCAGADSPVTRGALLWLGLLAIQFALGATIIWTNKAADVATAHVGVGALSLLTGTLLILVSRKLSVTERVRSAQPVVPALVGSVAR